MHTRKNEIRSAHWHFARRYMREALGYENTMRKRIGRLACAWRACRAFYAGAVAHEID